jgi:hypothetical protein
MGIIPMTCILGILSAGLYSRQRKAKVPPEFATHQNEDVIAAGTEDAVATGTELKEVSSSTAV